MHILEIIFKRSTLFFPVLIRLELKRNSWLVVIKISKGYCQLGDFFLTQSMFIWVNLFLNNSFKLFIFLHDSIDYTLGFSRHHVGEISIKGITCCGRCRKGCINAVIASTIRSESPTWNLIAVYLVLLRWKRIVHATSISLQIGILLCSTWILSLFHWA